jgi:hypothetical protein
MRDNQTDHYKQVKNYICNSLNLSRHWIEELVCNRVNLLVSRKLEDLFKTNLFRKYIMEVTLEILNKKEGSGTGDPVWDLLHSNSIDDYIKDELRKILHQEITNALKEHYKIEVKIEEKKDEI